MTRNERSWAELGHSGLLFQKTIHFCSNFPVSWWLGLLNTLFICGDMAFAIVVIFCQVAPSTALAVLKSWGYAVDSKHHHILPVVSESINCFQSSLLEEPEGPIENNKIWVLLRGAHLYSHLVMQCDKTSEFWTALLLLHGHSFMKKDILIWCLN